MDGFTVYDKAKWHYGGKFPKGLPKAQAYVHTGMFLTWVIDHDLYSDEFLADNRDQIAAVKRRETLGSAVYARADGVLAEDMLSDEGNAFARYYYNRDPTVDPSYLRDYTIVLEPDPDDAYRAEDSWENYRRLASVIDQRYQDWLNARQSESGRE